ncbi:MAG: acetate kinase [Gemmatimonadetes bacterium]|nr:MAG: acetate kinase [Gemmatimonadota bacterium]
MKILTLNCGSSSIKFDVIETDLELIQQGADYSIVRGLVEKIGLPGSQIRYTYNGESYKDVVEILDHTEALKKIIDVLTGDSPHILESLEEIAGVGHRLVHGAEVFSKSILIDEEVEKQVDECSEFAPLHNPQNLKGVRIAKEFFPNVAHVGVFDTGFHHSMPPYAYIYPLPYYFYRKYKIRRYGFHGTSHRFVSFRVGQLIGIPREKLKIITVHLGNGCSICAIDHGKSVDTSMGITPLEGLMMGTRTGDLDPAVILHIMAKEDLSLHQADTMMNKHSGLYGVSGISNDLREIIEVMDNETEGVNRARLAFDMFCYRVKKYISAYMGVLGGADVVVFTGGIGENAWQVREVATHGLDFMGIRIDPVQNREILGREGDITAEGATVRTFVVPTNEELVIARDTVRCMEGVL